MNKDRLRRFIDKFYDREHFILSQSLSCRHRKINVLHTVALRDVDFFVIPTRSRVVTAQIEDRLYPVSLDDAVKIGRRKLGGSVEFPRLYCMKVSVVLDEPVDSAGERSERQYATRKPYSCAPGRPPWRIGTGLLPGNQLLVLVEHEPAAAAALQIVHLPANRGDWAGLDGKGTHTRCKV